MPSRKSDLARRSDAPPASTARFAPIEDDAAPAPSSAPMQTPTPAGPAPAPAPTPSPALALPAMDTSMPPPSLPPPGSSQTPDAVAPFQQARPGSGSGPGQPPNLLGGGAAHPAQQHATPSEKGKEREEGKSGPGGHPKEAITIPIEVRAEADRASWPSPAEERARTRLTE